MEKGILNARELAQVKRIAMNVDSNFQKVQKLEVKIKELIKERDSIQADIDEMEAPVIRKTGGYKSTDIYEKVVIPVFNENGTPKTDKEGRQIKNTKYSLKWPDTIVPPIKETIVPPMTEGAAENNLDADEKSFNIDKESEENTVINTGDSAFGFTI